MQKIADVKDVLTKTGGERYGGEAISQLQHALQCASLAEAAHASPALISAALLHDIGHLVDRHSEGAAAAGIDRLHEKIGAGYLEKALGPAAFIAQPFAEDAVNLRRWDDLAKDPAVDTAGLDHFLPYLQAAAASHLH
jgi:predicted HD phosphohydrolase